VQSLLPVSSTFNRRTSNLAKNLDIHSSRFIIDSSHNHLLHLPLLVMNMELTWSLDYCLACDKQTQGDTYCSQSCRLADLEASSDWSGPTSPTMNSPSEASKGSGFQLPPAINFSAYKSSTTLLSSAASQATSPLTSYFTSHTPTQVAATKTLTPSSSSSSLSSTKSVSSQVNQLSEQARNELLGYSNSFDNVRNWKRRMNLS